MTDLEFQDWAKEYVAFRSVHEPIAEIQKRFLEVKVMELARFWAPYPVLMRIYGPDGFMAKYRTSL